MSAAITGGSFAADPLADEHTVGQLAEQAAQAVRALNHLTRPGVGAVTDPAEVCEIVAGLACTAGRSPQLLGQLSEWLVSQDRAGRLRVDACSPQPDPAAVVAAAIGELAHASQCAHHAGRALDAAQQHLAHPGRHLRQQRTADIMNAGTPAGVDALEPMSSAGAGTYQRLRAHLADLKLAAAAEALTGVLDAARDEDLSLITVLERLLAVEVAAVAARRHAGLLRFASLPAPYTLDQFDYSAQPGVDEKLIHELATLRFLDDAGNILLVGQPGTGKTMLAVGLARAGIEAGHRSTSPPPPTWPNAANAPRSRAAGLPRCASTAARACS